MRISELRAAALGPNHLRAIPEREFSVIKSPTNSSKPSQNRFEQAVGLAQGYLRSSAQAPALERQGKQQADKEAGGLLSGFKELAQLAQTGLQQVETSLGRSVPQAISSSLKAGGVAGAIMAGLGATGMVAAAPIGGAVLGTGAVYGLARYGVSKLNAAIEKTQVAELQNFLESRKAGSLEDVSRDRHSAAIPSSCVVYYLDISGSTKLIQDKGANFLTSLNREFLSIIHEELKANGIDTAKHFLGVHGGDGFAALLPRSILAKIQPKLSWWVQRLKETHQINLYDRVLSPSDLENKGKLSFIRNSEGSLQPHLELGVEEKQIKADPSLAPTNRLHKLFARNSEMQARVESLQDGKQLRFAGETEALALIATPRPGERLDVFSTKVLDLIDNIYGNAYQRKKAMEKALSDSAGLDPEEAGAISRNNDAERVGTFFLVSDPAKTEALRRGLAELKMGHIGLDVSKEVDICAPLEGKYMLATGNLTKASTPWKASKQG